MRWPRRLKLAIRKLRVGLPRALIKWLVLGERETPDMSSEEPPGAFVRKKCLKISLITSLLMRQPSSPWLMPSP